MMRLLKMLLLISIGLAPITTWGATCTVTGVTLAFGTYTGSQIATTTTITTNCPAPVTSYQVGLNAGTGTGATTTTREMAGTGSAELGYGMYQNSTHATNWGNTSGTDTVTVTGTGSKMTTVYGLLPAAEAPTPGSFKDTITVSVYASIGTFTATFQVSATVSAYCSISASALAFGTYSGALLKVNSSVSANCTNTTPYNVGLNQGTATGATVTTRQMTGPSSSLLNYTLYSNSGLTTNWGNTVGTSTLAGTGTGSTQSLTVYGVIPSGQYVRPGSYSDTITATITY